ncbi:YpoC family protein [Neobacillus jeddahensis]|uniref:YpoC family protein n=1 Tax=Neobacillus jeddahensis TaxID=1461580 RepID=UPI0006934F55|nr:hypothetical protein [Neobacillus jeddahensis]
MDRRAETVENILREWEGIKAQIEPLFRERDHNNVKEWMEKGISIFKQFLCFTNEETPSQSEQIPYHQFHFKPVNIEERLSFIISRPNLYHSYRQLSELMVEQQKQFVKSTIIKKSSRPHA